MQIIQRILVLLDEKHLKQSDLAKFLEIKNNVVTNWKQRKTDPPAKYIAKICDFLEVSLEYLLTGEGIKNIELTEDQKEFLTLFSKLQPKERYKLLGRLQAMTEETDEN